MGSHFRPFVLHFIVECVLMLAATFYIVDTFEADVFVWVDQIDGVGVWLYYVIGFESSMIRHDSRLITVRDLFAQ